MLALLEKKSRCRKFQKKKGNTLSLPCNSQALILAIAFSAEGEGSTSACSVPSLLGSQWPESGLADSLCFLAAFYCEQENRAAVNYLRSNSVFTSFKWSLLLFIFHKHLVQSQHTVGNLFSSVIEQRLEWSFLDNPLLTLVPSTASLLRDLAAFP